MITETSSTTVLIIHANDWFHHYFVIISNNAKIFNSSISANELNMKCVIQLQKLLSMIE